RRSQRAHPPRSPPPPCSAAVTGRQTAPPPSPAATALAAVRPAIQAAAAKIPSPEAGPSTALGLGARHRPSLTPPRSCDAGVLPVQRGHAGAAPGSWPLSQQHLLHHQNHSIFECMFDALSKHPPTDTVKRARGSWRPLPRGSHLERGGYLPQLAEPQRTVDTPMRAHPGQFATDELGFEGLSYQSSS